MLDGVRGVVFDCDGVLVDSEPASMQAWVLALTGLGVEVDAAAIGAWIGNTDRSIAQHYASVLAAEPEEILDVAERHLRQVLAEDGVRVFPDAIRLLETAFERRFPVGVATNSVRWRLDAVLEAAGIGHLIPLSVAADEVDAPKPAPDVYAEAVRRLALVPGETLVVEDTPTGIAAGKAAGCRVVAVDRGVFPLDRLAAADLVVAHLG
jgi:HAD superfamily hydrolase (TIGR01509 family)